MTCTNQLLKNIKFKSLSVMVLTIDHTSRVLIRWQLEPTAQNLKNLRFFVDRSEGVDFQQVNPEGITPYGLYEFVDETANLIDLNKIYYYRVRAVELGPQGQELQTFTSPHTTWDGDLDLVGIYINEEHYFKFRWVTGVPVMIYKKRHDGTLCPECWDKVLKRSTKSNCEVCYGTGRIGGYYSPFESWMEFEPDPKSEQVVDWGLKQTAQSEVMALGYPLLTPDDIIVELKPNRFWKIENVKYPEKNRTVTLQWAKVNAVYPSDVEYKIEVPEIRRRYLVDQLEAREKEREF